MTHVLTRRAALAGLAGAPLLSVIPAFAQVPVFAPSTDSGRAAGLRFRAVAVDATRIAALGDPEGVDRLEAALGRQMRAVFGDLMAPNDATGARLVAKLSSLSLTPYTGGRAYGHGGGGAADDALEGIGIVTSGGRLVSETPILAVLDPADSGAWSSPDIDVLRVDALAHQFAWWLRREMGV